jgi:hypothetical protein
MKKREIMEILDSDGNLIGSDDKPANNPNEIAADGTTDHNAAIGHQHFAHDFLGRFGFYMYNEGEGDDNSSSTDDLLSDVAKAAYDYFVNISGEDTSFEMLPAEMKNHYYDFGKLIVNLLGNKTPKKEIEPTLSENEISKMIEDVITSRSDDKSIVKKNDNDVLDTKVKDKIKSLIASLSDADKGELIKHLKK